jgi:predicted unusual protein kinase regulating ubiquinone biosynthesis (AarF/ABC1/UbiB family)
MEKNFGNLNIDADRDGQASADCEFHHRTASNSRQPITIDRSRYRRVRNFFFRIFLHVIWWDVILNRPVIKIFRKSPLPRWQALASEFRSLAIEMGGVLIKLGQFLSVRVDILPVEVTRELAGLQDKVPPEKYADIKKQIEEDFECPIAQIFRSFDPEPVGAASLAQAHSAMLVSGQDVVVKVLRPGIEVLVESDLTAISKAISWLKVYRFVRRRVNLDQLAEEFSSVTRSELDLQLEANNAERFSLQFKTNPLVMVPKIYWEQSSARTLTLENVGFIKIDDRLRLRKNGIDTGQVAKALYQIYMEQIFVLNFVHADPHSGNLFVQSDVQRQSTHKNQESTPPFRIAFVDFGMMSVIPEALRAALRAYAIGIGTGNAKMIVGAYKSAGILLPNADQERLEEATADMLQRFSQVRMGEMRDLAVREAQYFLHEYRDLVYASPIQFPVELLFVLRSVGMLAGLTTTLDPNFSPIAETIPFATRLARGEFGSKEGTIADEFRRRLQHLLEIPIRLEQLLSQYEDGTLTTTSKLSSASLRTIKRVERAQQKTAMAVASAGLLIAGAQLIKTTDTAIIGWIFLGFGSLLALKSVIKRS